MSAGSAPGVEFELIRTLFRDRGARRSDVLLGIGDDAALLAPTAAETLVACVDTLVADVHFPGDAPPDSVGHKALAVNLSDLAAMAAEPRWVLLSVTLPAADRDWLQAFVSGFDRLARSQHVALVGGDTCQGPLSITVQALGSVPVGQALRRSGARAGDRIVVSGAPGEAGLGLRLLQAGGIDAVRDDDRELVARLLQRLHRPTPRVSLGRVLRGLATACIDISDGLVADLGHVLDASGVGARVDVDALPIAPAVQQLVGFEPARQAALGAGDDYELCFTIPPDSMDALQRIGQHLGLALTVIGRIEAEPGLRLQTGGGLPFVCPDAGYRHFSDDSEAREVDDGSA